MNNNNTTWNRDYLKGYLLLYCAHADLNLSEQESEFIRSRLNDLKLDQIKEEFDKDSDYDSLAKIQSAFKRLDYTEVDRDTLFEEIKRFFNSDGEFDQVENYLHKNLMRLLQ